MKNTKKLVLSALFLAIGLILPFITGSGKNALSDAYPGVVVRFYCRLAIWSDRWFYHTIASKCAVWYAYDGAECSVYGI